jgi:hypothetical protein
MQKFYLLQVLVLFAICCDAQLVIGEGTRIRSTGPVFLSAENMNLVNNGQAELDNSTVVLRGAGPLAVSGLASWNFSNLTIDKTAIPVSLGANIFIGGKLAFLQGVLDMNGKLITLDASATLEGETEDKRIVGPNGGAVQITLPLAAPVAVNPGKLGVVISSAANLGLTTIRRFHQPPGPSAGGTVQRFFEIAPTTNTALSATVRFTYLDAELNNLTEGSLQLSGSTNGGTSWEAKGYDDRNPVSNYVEKNGLGSLELYTLSTPFIATSSVSWGDIQALCKGKAVQVKWTTLQEHNLQQFVVQRRSTGLTWLNIATVAAAGSTAGTKTYSFNDASAPAGGNSYRVMATGGGSSFYSATADASPCKKVIAQLIPMPAVNTTTLNVISEDAFQPTLSIVGLDGKFYLQKRIAIQPGNNQFSLDVSTLKSGTYYLQLPFPTGEKEILLLIKQ